MNINEKVLSANKFDSFNEVQKKCLNKLDKSLVVSAPTASGKTIIAELFLLDQVINNKKKVIYTCPLRALATEHYKDFKNKYRDIKFAVSTGDFDSNSSYLKKFDVIFTTYEKLASLQRHKAEWLNQVGCLIVDEIHELDSDRGPVLEIAITQSRINNPKIKILGLSATIPNAKELAKWLDAELVESEWRPTKLKEGVSFENEIEFLDGEIKKGNLENEIDTFLSENKQVLIFLNSRKRAETYALKIKSKTKNKTNENQKKYLKDLSNKILSVLETPTTQCHTLADCVKEGSAFHHAGLLPKQRELIEENFKLGKIHIICATPTLAAGINIPADLVVIPSLYRYSKMGMDLISVREYKQMSGRSGRPKFSSEGRSIVLANTINQKELYIEKYLGGLLEPINSKLAIGQILRTQTLGLVATNDIYDDKSILAFFKKTLYANQFGSITQIYENVSTIIDELIEMGFVEKQDNFFKCNLIGKRVSDLFLDPKSAFDLITALKSKKDFNEMSYLFVWSKMNEFYPKISLSKKISKIIFDEFNSQLRYLPYSEEELFFETDSVETYFNALVLKEWINEKKEQELFDDFGLLPGTLFSKTQIIDWLSYSTIELAKVLGENRHITESRKIAMRVKYGVREELLSLVELKGIGRVRARKLFRAGIKKPSDIKKNTFQVQKILGEKITQELKKQLKIS